LAIASIINVALNNSTGAPATDDWTVDVYLNDGPVDPASGLMQPGTLIASATTTVIMPPNNQTVMFDFTALGVVVPDTFTVVISSTHPTNTFFGPEGRLALNRFTIKRAPGSRRRCVINAMPDCDMLRTPAISRGMLGSTWKRRSGFNFPCRSIESVAGALPGQPGSSVWPSREKGAPWFFSRTNGFSQTPGFELRHGLRYAFAP
jgi:hypothetical protein